MFNYSGPMIPNSISWWISNSSDKYILTAFSGVTVNGIYAISYKIPSILSIITSVFSNAWILSAVEKFGSKESEDFYNDIYDKYISLSLICTSALILLGRFFALFIFANEFYEAWKYQPILIIGVAFHALSGFLGSVFSAAKKTKMLFYSTLIGALTNIVLNFVLIPVLSAYGAAIATTLSYVIVYVVRAVNSKKYIKLKMDYKKVLLSLLCLVGQMCSIYLFDYIINVFSVVLFIVLLLLNKGLVIDTYKAVIVKRKKNL